MFNTHAWPPDPAKPTLVFIHGSGNSKSLWAEQVDALSETANAVALDLPGHGGSGGDGKNDVGEYAGVVTDFIKSAGIPGPVPCGLSLGGAIVIRMLIDKKLEYKGGVIMNSGARLKVHPVIFETIKNDYRSFIAMAAKTAVSEKTEISKIGRVIKDWDSTSPQVVYGDFDSCNKFDAMADIHSISVPVLVITSEDDKLTPARYGIYLAENIKNSKRVHLMECGHLSPLEKPGEVNAALRDYIKNFLAH